MPAQVISYIDTPGPDLSDRDLELTLGGRLTVAERREPEAYSDFRSAANGQPTSLDSGQKWTHTGPIGGSHELRVVDGALTNEIASGPTAGYAEAELAGTVTRIGAKVTFGAYSTDDGVAALAIVSAPFDDSDIPAMSCHLVVGPTRYIFGVWENPGTLVSLQTRDFDTPLTADGATEHMIEVQIVGSTATILVSGGIVGQVTDARIATSGGPYCYWEVYAVDAATDSKAAFQEVWADSRIESYRATGASVATLAEAVLGRTTTVARHYVGTDDNVTLTGSFQELNTALRCPIIFPRSGKLLVEFTGYLISTSGTAVILAIFYDEGLTVTAQTHWITQGAQAYDGNFRTSAIVTNEPGSSGTFYVGAWRVSGDAVMHLGPNNPNVLKVTSL